MDAQDRLRVPDIKFRILIIGRANAGKTSILQRVCDSLDSPEIYRHDGSGTRHRIQLEHTMERGKHNIEDELTFPSHDGYVFHDSPGFEWGSVDEFRIVQDFVRRKSQERRLQDRLHAIWYCIPMDNDRPSLELRHFGDICPDNKVPVIAVFTKFDQFTRDIKMKLEDDGRDPETDLDAEVEGVFKRHYLAGLAGSPPFIRLERMHKPGRRVAELIELTANVLSGGVVALMLMAVQKDSLELSIKQAIKWTYSGFKRGIANTETVIKLCVMAFPSIRRLLDDDLLDVRSPPSLAFSHALTCPSMRAHQLLDDLKLDNNAGDLDAFDNLINSVTSPRVVPSHRATQLDDFLLLVLFNNVLDNDNFENKPFFSKLKSFVANPPLSVCNNDAHHTMIAIILILEHAGLFLASSYSPTLNEALDKAYSQYISSEIHSVVKEQFFQPPKQYSILNFTEFILENRF